MPEIKYKICYDGIKKEWSAMLGANTLISKDLCVILGLIEIWEKTK